MNPIKKIKKQVKKGSNFIFKEKYLTLLNRKENYHHYTILFACILSFSVGYLLNTAAYMQARNLEYHAGSILSASSEAGVAVDTQEDSTAVVIKADSQPQLQELVTNLYQKTVPPSPTPETKSDEQVAGLIAGVDSQGSELNPTTTPAAQVITPSPTPKTQIRGSSTAADTGSDQSGTNDTTATATPQPTAIPTLAKPSHTLAVATPTMTANPTTTPILVPTVAPTKTVSIAPTEKKDKYKDIKTDKVLGLSQEVVWWARLANFAKALVKTFF